jgi:hypothetical protein
MRLGSGLPTLLQDTNGRRDAGSDRAVALGSPRPARRTPPRSRGRAQGRPAPGRSSGRATSGTGRVDPPPSAPVLAACGTRGSGPSSARSHHDVVATRRRCPRESVEVARDASARARDAGVTGVPRRGRVRFRGQQSRPLLRRRRSCSSRVSPCRGPRGRRLLLAPRAARRDEPSGGRGDHRLGPPLSWARAAAKVAGLAHPGGPNRAGLRRSDVRRS